MITYVQYDEVGDLVAVVEVLTTEAHDVEPPTPGMTAAQRTARRKRVDAAVKAREDETRAELAAHVTAGHRLLVLDDGAALPDLDLDAVNPATRKLRRRSAAEVEARRAQREAAAAAAAQL